MDHEEQYDQRIKLAQQGDIEAIDWLHKLAGQGHANAQFKLGEIYSHGGVVPKDLREVVKWYQQAAEQGHVEAQFQLGLLYSRVGDDVSTAIIPPNFQEAIKWYRKAAEQGHVQAQRNLKGLSENDQVKLEQKIKRLREQSARGDSSAQYQLGWSYANGVGVTKNYQDAFQWFLRAAREGNVDAQEELASMYASGKGVTQDDLESIKWLHKVIEHREGKLGNYGFNQPRKSTYTWIMLLDICLGASIGGGVGFLGAEVMELFIGILVGGAVGAFYFFNSARFTLYYEYCQLAEQKEADVDLFYLLGYMSLYGENAPRNFQDAAKWFHKVIELDGSKNPHLKRFKTWSQRNLGLMYAKGLGVPKDYKEAIRWFQIAAQQGDDIARRNLSIYSIT